jgi:CNT family concentrative nucleoside transporter
VIQALAGIGGLLLLAWLLSENRRAIPWRAIGAGLLLQLVLALLLIKLPFAKELFISLNEVLTSVEKATQAGTSLVFGYLGGGAAPFAVTDANANFILAFRALPIVLVMSALSALLRSCW